MAVVKNMMVRAGADFSAITTQSKKASSSMRAMQTSVTRSCSGMSKAVGALKKAFTLTAIIYAAKKVYQAGKEAAAAYDQQAEAEMKLARVMRNTMRAGNSEIQTVLDLASAQQKLGVVGDEVQLAGAQELATYLSLSSSLQKLIPVMNDMAAQQYGYNVTAEQTTTIATMLGKVMNGQVSALSRYGYTFDEAQEKILKFGNEEERAAVLAEVVEQSVGGMNRALAQTPTGRVKQLSNTLGDIKEKFGQAVRSIGVLFIPLLNKVADILAAVATLANKVAEVFVKLFGGTAAGKEWEYLPDTGVGDISEAMWDTDDATESAADGMGDLAKATQKAKKAAEELRAVADFDTLHILKFPQEDTDEDAGDGNASGSSDPWKAASSGNSTSKIKETDTGSQTYESLLDKLKALWEALKDTLTKMKDGAIATWEPVAAWFSANVFEPISAGAAALSGAVSQALSGAKEWVCASWEPVAAWFSASVFQPISAGAAALSGAVSQALSGAKEWVCASWEPVAAWFSTSVFQPIGDAAVNAWNSISSTANAASQQISAGWQSITTQLSQNFQQLQQKAANAWQAMGAAATNAGQRIKSGWQNLMTQLSQSFQQLQQKAANVWQAMGTAATSAGQSIKSGWQNLMIQLSQEVQKLKDKGTEVGNSIKSSATAAGEFMKTTAQVTATLVLQHLQAIREQGSQALSAVRSAGEQAGNAIRSSFQNAYSAITSAFGKLGSWFKSTVFAPILNGVNSMISGISSAFDKLGSKISSLTSKLKGVDLSKLWSKVKGVDWAQLAVDLPGYIGGSGLLSGLSGLSGLGSLGSLGAIPGLASGAVIPPNREFTAVLGDQTSGRNIETPERLLRQIMRQEMAAVSGMHASAGATLSQAMSEGNTSGLLLSALDEILDAIMAGHDIILDDTRVSKTVRRIMREQGRIAGAVRA